MQKKTETELFYHLGVNFLKIDWTIFESDPIFIKFSHISKGFQNLDPGLRLRPRQKTPTCVLKMLPNFDQL